MEKEAIEKIEELVRNSLTVHVNNKDFTAAALKPVIYEPRPPAITVHNLRGFCGFINKNIDEVITDSGYLIVVNSPQSVDLLSAYGGDDMKRTILVSAQMSDGLKEFPFGMFLTQEAFAISFRSLFVANKNDDFEYVLQYVSKLAAEASIESEDDGISQKVTVKKGASGALKTKETLKPIVKLTPYRTFREAEQPESEFLLRIRCNENEAPQAALFEADGGVWINKATENVENYLKTLVSIPVIA